ncbi:allophanate hydrolase [Marisediminicola sp. LYQ85]|uniref:allophanate hydrolase n=1 Tax=Marisediminicola sp. LYQ85 TaxID=3391062 RepID=UPI003983C91F
MTTAVTTSVAHDRVLAAFERLEAAAQPEVWITVRSREEVLAAASDIDARFAAGEALPLYGTVFAVKDNIDVAGLPTTAAHPDFSYEPVADSTVVSRLVAAGAIVIGKTNMDQFATGLVGTRSPFGVVHSAIKPERVSGGSSSGSAVAVASGIVDFSLGTDTAGSGRVPAAYNGLVGLKPTRGVIPVTGVVPASISYDCVSIFAPTMSLAADVLRVAAGADASDPYSRAWPAFTPLAAPARPRVAVPDDAELARLSPETRAAFEAAVRDLNARGVETAPIDITPFMDASGLLYSGALVAERHDAFGDFVTSNTEHADPSVLTIATNAWTLRATDLARDQRLVQEQRLRGIQALDGFDALLLPTAPEHPTIADVQSDPLVVNSRLGRYTNFVNLFDLAAVAIPAGEADGGMFGVTFVTRGFADQVGIDLAALMLDEDPPLVVDGATSLVVFGAHLSGQPLNAQLEAAGGRLVGLVQTSADYRLYDVPGPIKRPGLVYEPGNGESIVGEEWMFSPAGLGEVVAQLTAPMSIGPIFLDDGRTVSGFQAAQVGGPDITAFGGWLAYLQEQAV